MSREFHGVGGSGVALRRGRALVAALLLATSLPAQEAENAVRESGAVRQGRELFAVQCAPCHTLTTDGIGPPLGGVTGVLARERLVAWIRNPAAILAAGDARAAALLARYKTPMPPMAHLDEAAVGAILEFIAHESATRHLKPFDPATAAPPPQRVAPPIEASNLVIEVEDVVQLPRLPGRTPYKGITLLRPDPREPGALFVDELMGVLYRVTDREVRVFLDVRGLFPEFLCDPGVASGLGSFALHPDFARNGLFYTTHSERSRGSPVVNPGDIPPGLPPGPTPPLEWVLTEWRLADPAARRFAGTHREVLRFAVPTTAHNAQELAFAPVTDPRDPDYGKLYLGIGDGGATNLKRSDLSGHPRTFFGSILRLDPAGHDAANGAYGIPADNPFANERDPAVHREIWAYGFRNPHRLSWDSAHRERLIAVDLGESNIEEVNLIEKGGAYGYGARGLEGTWRLDPVLDPKVVHPATPEELAGTRPPFAAYDHLDGSAITGGYVYHGPLAALRDKYIFGDIVSGRIFCLNFGATLDDHTIREITLMRDGAVTGVKALAHADRAHLRLGYDERTGDLFLLTKDDGMIRRVTKAYLQPATPAR